VYNKKLNKKKYLLLIINFMEFKKKIDKIIHEIGNYQEISDNDIDYIISLPKKDIKVVLEKYKASLKALMLINEFIIKEMD